MKKFVTNFRKFLNESAIRKKRTRSETLFIFTTEQFQSFDQYCQNQFGFSLVGSQYVEQIGAEPEQPLAAVAEAAAADRDWEK